MPTEWKYVVSMETLNDYTVRAKLTVLNLQPEDFTDFNCSARNTLGEDTGIIKLQSKAFPPITFPSKWNS